MPSFSPPRNQSGRSTRSTESHSTEDHASIAASSTSNGHKELRKPKSFINPLNVIRRARSKVRLEADERQMQAAANKTQPLLPTFVSSGSGESSFLQMDPSPSKSTLRAVRGREKKKPKGSPAQPPQSNLQPEFNIDLNLERMEGIIDPSLLPQSTNSGSISSVGFGDASMSGFLTDARALTPSSSSSSPPHFSGPVFSDPFVSRPPSVRSREDTIDLRRMSPHTIAPALLPTQLVSPSSGSQDGRAAWKAPPSWVTGDQPEPDVSSSEDEKGSAGKPKPRKRPSIPRPSVSHGMDIRNFKIRVYRANNEYHILTCSLATTVGQLSGVLNAKLLNPGEREDYRLYLKERGRGWSRCFDLI
jgi:adenylate cyclase